MTFGLEPFANNCQLQLVLKHKRPLQMLEKFYLKWKYLPAMLLIENAIRKMINGIRIRNKGIKRRPENTIMVFLNLFPVSLNNSSTVNSIPRKGGEVYLPPPTNFFHKIVTEICFFSVTLNLRHLVTRRYRISFTLLLVFRK